MTILRVKLDKLTPKNIKCNDYKNFESKAFNHKLQVCLQNFNRNNSDFIELQTIFMELLNKVTLLETKYVRAYYSEFLTKTLICPRNLFVCFFRKTPKPL